MHLFIHMKPIGKLICFQESKSTDFTFKFGDCWYWSIDKNIQLKFSSVATIAVILNNIWALMKIFFYDDTHLKQYLDDSLLIEMPLASQSIVFAELYL